MSIAAVFTRDWSVRTIRSIRLMRWAMLGQFALAGGCASDPLGPLPLTWRIKEAQRRWTRTNIRTYSFYSTISCFCPDEYGSRKAVSVQNGVVISVRDQPTGVVRPLNFRQPIDSAFALLRREAWSGRVQAVEFDARLGYPTRMSFGSDAPDDGALMLIEELQTRS